MNMPVRYTNNDNTIYFSSYTDYAPYNKFSNFYPVKLFWEGILYKSLEHAYQSAKTDNYKEKLDIRQAATAAIAKKLGSKCTVRPDWQDNKRRIMKNLVRAKFLQNDEIRLLLINTKDCLLVEDAAWDSYWGNGRDGKGSNELGKILMEVRQEVIERGKLCK